MYVLRGVKRACDFAGNRFGLRDIINKGGEKKGKRLVCASTNTLVMVRRRPCLCVKKWDVKVTA